MPVLKTITFAYRALEDRVLAAVNLGHPDAWSCWLTRRLSLALLERAGKLLVEQFSARKSCGSRLPRRACRIRTGCGNGGDRQGNVTNSAGCAQCVGARCRARREADNHPARRTFAHRAGRRPRWHHDTGLLLRADFQRILRMLEAEVLRGKWVMVTEAPGPAQQTDAPKPARH